MRRKESLNKFSPGKIYILKKDLDQNWLWKDVYPPVKAFLPKGTKMMYIGKSLGNAHFRLLEKIDTWMKGNVHEVEVIIPGKEAFRILEEDEYNEE